MHAGDHARRHLLRRRHADRGGRRLRHARAAARLLLVPLASRSADLVKVLVESSRATGIVAITIAGALVMNWIVAAEQIPERMGDWMTALDMSPAVFLLVVNILFLMLGAFLDTLLMLLIIVPILMPTVIELGIDPVHFGVVSVVNMMIGLVTPPMGELVFLIAGVSGIKVAEITKELWIFLIVLIALLFVLVYVPATHALAARTDGLPAAGSGR